MLIYVMYMKMSTKDFEFECPTPYILSNDYYDKMVVTPHQ